MAGWNASGAGRALRLLGAFAAGLSVTTLLAQSGGDLGYTSKVSAMLKSQFAQKYGGGTSERIEDWIRQGRAPGAPRKNVPDAELLRAVNSYFNRLKYAEDQAHWGEQDYWATPLEMVASNAGDCEDYAIAKYYLLKELGMPIGRLRITYVKALKLNQAHMVLAYYATTGADPLILDNLEQQIRPASERLDLDPVYGFNDDEVELAKTGQKGAPSQIRAWQTVQGRLRAQSRT